VQLAQTVGEDHGPAAAEAAVAQVGVDVGGQMEEAYRRVTVWLGEAPASSHEVVHVNLGEPSSRSPI
jgi:hypothetical protein